MNLRLSILFDASSIHRQYLLECLFLLMNPLSITAVYRHSTSDLFAICKRFVGDLSTIYQRSFYDLSAIYLRSISNISAIYRQSTFYWSIRNLSAICQQYISGLSAIYQQSINISWWHQRFPDSREKIWKISQIIEINFVNL